MEANIDVAGDAATLSLAGALTVECAAELKSALMDVLAKAASVRVEFGRVTEMNLSCLQLLCSAHRTAMSEGKAMTVRPDAEGAYRRMTWRAGFVRHEGCEPAGADNCLWLGGDHL